MIVISMLICVLSGCMAALVAKGRGRSAYAWFIIGVFFGVFGLILLFLLPPVTIEETVVAEKPVHDEEFLPASDWFYLDAEKRQRGPIGMHEMRDLWAKGQLTDKSWVWHESFVAWQRIEAISNLRQTLSSL